MQLKLDLPLPHAHIDASIKYIQEMNDGMLDAIWLDGEIDFNGVSRQDFMRQLASYFKAVRKNGETWLKVKKGKCQDRFFDTSNPVYFFYSPKDCSYFNLIFQMKNGQIDDITICTSFNGLFPECYFDRSFTFLHDQKLDFVLTQQYIEETLLVKRVVSEFYGIKVWDIEKIQSMLQKIAFLFDTLEDDCIYGSSIASVKFRNINTLLFNIQILLESRMQIETMVNDWKVAVILNDNKLKLDLFFDIYDLCSYGTDHQITIGNNTVAFNDDIYTCDLEITLADDLSFIEVFNSLVVPLSPLIKSVNIILLDVYGFLI